MTFKALQLDEADVLVGVVELESESELTERHVDLRPHGGDCDRQSGAYRWDRQRKTLVPLPRHRRVQADEVPSLEQAFYALATGGKESPAVKAWVQWYEQSLEGRRAK